jgi:hypothetical protein
MKSAGIWICEDCDQEAQVDYAWIARNGTPGCECGEDMEFDHEVFFEVEGET